MLKELWQVFVLLAFVPGGIALAMYRAYRYHKKHWCPNCRRWSAAVYHERELPSREMPFSRWRICQTVKECPHCGYGDVLREPYLKEFSEWRLRWGEHRRNVRNF